MEIELLCIACMGYVVHHSSEWCEYINMYGLSSNCMLTSTCGFVVCVNNHDLDE